MPASHLRSALVHQWHRIDKMIGNNSKKINDTDHELNAQILGFWNGDVKQYFQGYTRNRPTHFLNVFIPRGLNIILGDNYDFRPRIYYITHYLNHPPVSNKTAADALRVLFLDLIHIYHLEWPYDFQNYNYSAPLPPLPPTSPLPASQIEYVTTLQRLMSSFERILSDNTDTDATILDQVPSSPTQNESAEDSIAGSPEHAIVNAIYPF